MDESLFFGGIYVILKHFPHGTEKSVDELFMSVCSCAIFMISRNILLYVDTTNSEICAALYVLGAFKQIKILSKFKT